MTQFVNRSFGSKANMGKGRIYYLWRKNGIKFCDQISNSLKLSDLNFNFPECNQLIYDLYHNDNIKSSNLINIDLSNCQYP